MLDSLIKDLKLKIQHRSFLLKSRTVKDLFDNFVAFIARRHV